jgi:hypothetical protein
MSLYITDGQKKRLKNIDKVLSKYLELDIPDNIINKINKKFKSTKYYRFIRTEELDKGMIIRYVDLEMKKISTTGIIVNIQNTSNKEKGVITLYNPSDIIYWKINPDKYYGFEVEKDTNNKNIDIREYYNKNIST